MNINVLDKDFNLIGVIDDFISVIWRPSFYDIGDFELYLNACSKYIDLLQQDYYLVRDTDIESKGEDIIYSYVMVIKNFKLTTDAENGDKLIVTGRELKHILSQRIVWEQTNLSGTAEAGIRRLVTENAISPTDTNRTIPNLMLGAEIGLNDAIRKQITGDNLAQSIIDICTVYNYGWDIIVINSTMMFILYTGIDRSYNQNTNAYVVFGDEFDNIINTEYELNTENFANTTLIGGEGEGSSRIYTTLNNDNVGLNRFEVFTDANDISRNADSEDVIDMNTYYGLLQERGLEKLAELSMTEAFGGEVENNLTFKYNEDFFIGDIVTVINKYGISKNVRVLSAIESVDDTGIKLIPQFSM